MTNRINEQTFRNISGDDSVPGFTPHPNPVAGIEQQSTFDFLRLCRMAFVTLLDQHRTNLPLEELQLIRGNLLGLNNRGQQGNQHKGADAGESRKLFVAYQFRLARRGRVGVSICIRSRDRCARWLIYFNG